MSLGMHARETADVVTALRVDPQLGLPIHESLRRRIHFGINIVELWPRPVACVLHEGQEMLVHACDLVPGDVIVVEAGADVPADARIVIASALVVDERALTGTAVAVAKSPSPVRDDEPLEERTSMLYLGTRVTGGRATAIVTATGDATELGRRRR